MLFDTMWQIRSAALVRDNAVSNRLFATLEAKYTAPELASTKAPYEAVKLFFKSLASVGLVEIKQDNALDSPLGNPVNTAPAVDMSPGWCWLKGRDKTGPWDLSVQFSSVTGGGICARTYFSTPQAPEGDPPAFRHRHVRPIRGSLEDGRWTSVYDVFTLGSLLHVLSRQLGAAWAANGVNANDQFKQRRSALHGILRESFEPANTFESAEEVADWMEVETIYDNLGPWGIVERVEASQHPHHSKEYMSAMAAMAEKVNGRPCPLAKEYPTEAEIEQQLDDLLRDHGLS